MFFKVLRVFVLLTLGIVFASCSGLAIQVAFDLEGPVLLESQENMILGESLYSIRFDEAIKKEVASPKNPITMELSTSTANGGTTATITVITANANASDPTQLDISFSASSLNVGDTITITIPEGYLTDEADNSNKRIEHKVTVVQGAASIGLFKFTSPNVIATIKGNTITATVPSGTVLNGLVATFTTSDGATVTVNGKTQTSGGSSNDFSSDVIYTVKDDTTTKEYTVTVSIARADLNEVTLTYVEVETTEGIANDTGADPAWTGDDPTGITYSITASGTNGPITDGSGTTVVIAPTTGKITITAQATVANSGTYTVTAMAKSSSNYAENTWQTATATVLIASSKATITALTLEIGGTNYLIEFGAGTTAKVVLPVGTSMPNSATVESVTLVTGASGLAQGGSVNINANGEANIRITAEDGITTNEYTVTVSIAKPNLSTATFSYSPSSTVTTTEGTDYTTGTPTWNGDEPTEITYSITGSTTNGPGTDGSATSTSTVKVDSAGQITITADAIPDNSGKYTVEATAGPTSNYADTTTQTTTVTVKVKGNLSNYSFSYPIAAQNSEDGSINVSPVWRKGTAEVTAPSGVSYSDTNDSQLSAIGLALNTTNGTISGTMLSLDKVTKYQITATGDNTDYAGSTTGTFLDTFFFGAEPPQVTTGTPISTVERLKDINKNLAGEYYLTNHIDLNNAPWTPIASKDSPFTGKLHGNGYAIYNLTITSTETHQGLFASVSGATIENLGIGVTNITGLAGVGALAGVANEKATLSNIAVAPMTADAKIEATDSATIEGHDSFTGSLLGGLVGLQRNGSLTGYSLVTVAGNGDRVGGLVGASYDTVVGFTTKDVTGTGNYTGGLVGESNGSTVRGSTSGTVSGTGNYTGGLVGASNDGGTVDGFATGSVTGQNYTGGLVGRSTNGTVIGYATGSVNGQDNTGGLVGFATMATNVTVGYATGAVSGTTNVGGLVGVNFGTVTGYATGTVSGTTDVGGLVGRSINGTVTGYATGAVSGTTNLGGLVGFNTGTGTGYWDMQSTGQDTSAGGATAVGISATRNIVFDADTNTYTDSGNSDSVIFDINAFPDIFDIFDTTTKKGQTWPKLKSAFTFNSIVYTFPFSQPTVSGTADDGTIDVAPPVEAEP